MTLREATWRNVIRLWRWRNDPVTRRWSRNTERVGLVEHLRWFWRMQRSDMVVIYISTFNGTPVGSARLAGIGSYAGLYAGVVIDPRWRGAGFGTATLRALTDRARRLGTDRLYAEIKAGNGASVRAFEKAGFREVPQSPLSGYYRMEWRAEPQGEGERIVSEGVIPA